MEHVNVKPSAGLPVRDGDAPCALVLGGREMLGQSLVNELLRRGWNVHTLEREESDSFPTVFSPEELTSRIVALRPDAVFNAIEWRHTDDVEQHPELATAINSGLPSLLGRIVRDLPAWFVQYSTASVFDGKKRVPYSETDPVGPVNVYGQTKCAAERALRELRLERGIIIRTGWLFGPRNDNLISMILHKAREKGFLAMAHDVYGSPTYAPDLSFATMELLERKVAGLFHFANAGRATVCELVAETLRLANRPVTVVGVSVEEEAHAARRPPYTVLSSALYEQTTGFAPRPWVHALREYVFGGFLEEE